MAPKLQATGRTKVTLGVEEYVFDETTLTLAEAFMIKAASGLNLKPFVAGLNDGDPTSYQALVWFCRHRAGQQMPIHEVNFTLADLRLEPILEPVPEESPDPTEPETSTDSGTGTSSDSLTTSD